MQVCGGGRPAAAPSGPEGGNSISLTALHLKFLVSPLQAIDLGLLISQELFKFVLDGLGQLVQLGTLQDLLQHCRHVDRTCDRGRRTTTGEERRGTGPRSRGRCVCSVGRRLARACPPETPAAGPWEIESDVRGEAPDAPRLPRRAADAAGTCAPWESEFRGGLRPPPSHATSGSQAQPLRASQASGKRSAFLTPFRDSRPRITRSASSSLPAPWLSSFGCRTTVHAVAP